EDIEAARGVRPGGDELRPSQEDRHAMLPVMLEVHVYRTADGARASQQRRSGVAPKQIARRVRRQAAGQHEIDASQPADGFADPPSAVELDHDVRESVPADRDGSEEAAEGGRNLQVVLADQDDWRGALGDPAPDGPVA